MLSVTASGIVKVKPKDGYFACPVDNCFRKYSLLAGLRTHCTLKHPALKVSGSECAIDWNAVNKKETVVRHTRKTTKDYTTLSIVQKTKGFKCPLCPEWTENFAAMQQHCDVHNVLVEQVDRLRYKDYSARRCMKNKIKREYLKQKMARESFGYKDAKKNGNHSTTKKQDQLVEVRQSTIEDAGLGIFACQDLQPGDVVTKYHGKWRKNPDKLTNLESSYSIDLEDGVLVGISEPVEGKGLASFVNRGGSTGARNNCMLLQGPLKRDVYLHIKKRVRAGAELLSPYGRNCKLSKMVQSDHL